VRAVFKRVADPVPALGVADCFKETTTLFVAAKGGELDDQAILGGGQFNDPAAERDAFIRTALIQLATSTYQRG